MTITKICGLDSPENAEIAVSHGADLLGIILVPNRKRTVDIATAKAISAIVRRKRQEKGAIEINKVISETRAEKFGHSKDYFEQMARAVEQNGPYLVGVFRNQPISEILSVVESTGIDIVQLHGNEDKVKYFARLGEAGISVIPRYVLEEPDLFQSLEKYSEYPTYLFPLLDSAAGGEGVKIDWNLVSLLGDQGGRFLLAGGLTPENVKDALKVNGSIGVDVSGGTETAGKKDSQKIIDFIRNSKTV